MYPEETIIYVTDEMFRPYILLKDIEGNLYWRPYGGETIENIRKFHKWELEAQKKFKDEKRSHEELDFLRNLLMSVTMVVDFFDLGDQTRQDMLGGVLDKISFKWYCADKKLDEKTFVPGDHEEDLKIYFELVMFYVTSFFNMIHGVVDSVEVANKTKHDS